MSKLTTSFSAFEKDTYQKIEGPFEIVKIIDIINDPEEIAKIEEGVTVDTGLQLKDIKRGQTIYLTAMLQKPGTTQSWNSQVLSVIACRVIDFWYGLNKLDSLQKSKKI